MKIKSSNLNSIANYFFCSILFISPIQTNSANRHGLSDFINYEKCILANSRNLTDRSALSAIKKSCFNLNHNPKTIPRAFWGNTIQLKFEDVRQRRSRIVGTEDWTQITVVNNTNFRITSITLRFDGDDGTKVFNIMTHPFLGYSDIDHIHVPSYSQRDRYYVDLRSYRETPKVTITDIQGIVEVETIK